jgi:hypothetical protein
MTDTPISLSRYVMTYTIAQAIVMAIPVALLLFDVDLGSSANVTGAFAAACITAYLFVRRIGRAPTIVERRRLAWLCLAAVWAISLTALGLLLLVTGPAFVDGLKQQLGGLPYYLLLGIVLLVSALYLGIYHLSYGWYAGVVARSLAKRRAAL